MVDRGADALSAVGARAGPAAHADRGGRALEVDPVGVHELPRAIDAAAGHDGTWVAHPALVPVAREVFDRGMPGPNQLERRWPDLRVTADDLLAVPPGPKTDGGLRGNLRVAVQYTAAWLAGTGCVPIDHRMEDAATAEISRAQVWQWVHHRVRLDDGSLVDAARVREVLAEVVSGLPQGPRLGQARALVERLCLAPELAPFLTSAAYAALD